MLTVLVINSKGGAGKTTLTTNLAGYYASRNARTAILDYDPQGSSMQWLKARPGHVPSIHGATASFSRGGTPLRSIQSWVPVDTEVLVIDAPAGAKGLLLQEMVRKSSYILIPVAPSPIDIRATADFIKELLLSGGARTSKAKIAVVANRVRTQSSPMYEALERFLNSLKLPFLTTIHDAENYLHSAEQGLSVFELDESATTAERRELMPVLRWLGEQFPHRFGSRIEDKVISLEETSKFTAFRKITQNPVVANITGGFRIPSFLKARDGES